MSRLHVFSVTLIVGLFMPWLAVADPPTTVPPAGPIGDIIGQLEALDTKVDDLETSVTELDTKVDNLQNSVDLLLESTMVPFRTTIPGGLCDAPALPASNPEIHISGALDSATFIVKSILIQTDGFTELNRIFGLTQVTINGVLFRTSSVRIFDTLFNAAPGAGVVAPGFDLMGLRLRESSNGGDPDEGGIFPTEIVANSDGDGIADVEVKLFCRSDDGNWSVETISVAGMKQIDDVISVSYIPGVN